MIITFLFDWIRTALGQPLPHSITNGLCYNCSEVSAFRKILGYALSPYVPQPLQSIAQMNVVILLAIIISGIVLLISYLIVKNFLSYI